MENKKEVPAWKKEKVKELKKLFNEYSIIGIVDVTGLPTLQLQRMKQQLKGKINLVMTRKRLIQLALEGSDKESLTKYLKNMPALLFSNESAFKLYKILKKGKSSAPAKAGQIANKDIVIPAGPTSFPPGPIIGEFGKIGIITSVENGKVTVTKDKVLVKEGGVISKDIADVLSKLGIEPMEVGLNLMVVYEKGEILTKDVLDVDEDKYINDIRSCSRDSLGLALSIGYANKETINLLIKKAFLDAKSIAFSKEILSDLNLKDLLFKAEKQSEVLMNKVG